MALYRRPGSANWWVSIYRGPEVARLRVSTGTADEHEARMIESALRQAHGGTSTRERLHRLIDELVPGEAAPSIPLSLVWTQYQRTAPEVVPHVLANRRGYWQRFAAWMEKHYPRAASMADVSRQVAIAYGDHLRSDCKTGKTANENRAGLRRIWQTLLVRAGLGENVWDLVPTVSTRDSRRRRAFTAEEIERILETAGGWRVPSLVAMYTGLRLSDIRRLRWEWIEGDVLRLAPSKTKRHGITVTLPLHRSVVAALEPLRHPSGLLFPELSDRATEPFAAVLERAGVSDGVAMLGFHCWRHTFRTLLAAAGVPQDVAKKLGGWTQDATAARYDHDTTQARAAIDRL